jgi:NitT/TauT family transport system substrate-binding protein
MRGVSRLDNHKKFVYILYQCDRQTNERTTALMKTLNQLGAVLVGASILLVTGCAGTPDSAPSDAPEITTVRLGYFPNLTHAPGLIATQKGFFKSELKAIDLTVTPTAFNAGPDVVTALFADSLDCSYIGPNPAINAYVQSEGAAVRIVAGSTSGGAALVVREGVDTPADLAGLTIATPQLGNTQDVAARNWLADQGFETDLEGGGDVSIKPQSNSDGLAAFSTGEIDGAWVPEPWVSSYVKAGAHVLQDETDLWDGGQFVTTVILCRTDFIEQHPDAVTALLKGHLAALDMITEDPKGSQESVNLALAGLTGSAIDEGVLAAAWENVAFTSDPLSTTLVTSADHAVSVGLLEKDKIDAAGGLPGTLYSLDLLNALRAERGETAVK